MKIEIILCVLGMFVCVGYLFKIFKTALFKERKEKILNAEKLLIFERKEKILNAEKLLIFERKKQYSLFLRRNLTQATNDLHRRINEPNFNSDDLVYILNKNGLYLVDVDTFDQSYDKGE